MDRIGRCQFKGKFGNRVAFCDLKGSTQDIQNWKNKKDHFDVRGQFRGEDSKGITVGIGA